jgi:hypothetical protein
MSVYLGAPHHGISVRLSMLSKALHNMPSKGTWPQGANGCKLLAASNRRSPGLCERTSESQWILSPFCTPKDDGGPEMPFTEVPPLWMAGKNDCKFCGKPNVGFVSASSRPSSSAESFTSSACRLSSSCASRRAPIMVEVTPGCPWTQASATRATVLSCALAMTFSSSTIA